MNQRTRSVLGLTLSACFLFFFGTPQIAYSVIPPAEKAYRSAERCVSQVRQLLPSKQTASQWNPCLTRFKDVAQKYAESSVADDAAFQAAEIYQTLYRRSEDEKDLREALNWYRRVIDRYPESLLKKNADRAIARLAPPAGAVSRVDSPVPSLPSAETPMLSAEEGTDAATNSGLVKGVRHWTGPQYTRVVFDLTSPASFNRQLQDSPPRLVIDLRPARMAKEMTPIPIRDGAVREVHAGQLDPETVRVVLDMDQLKPYKVFSLSKPDRLVIDVLGSTSTSEPGWIPATVPLPAAAPAEPPGSMTPVSPLSPEATTEIPLPWDTGAVKGIRNWTGNGYTRVVADLSSPTTFNPQVLDDPPRLVVDLRPARISGEMTPIPIRDGTVQEIQAGQLNPDTVRLVLLMERIEPYKVFSLINPDRLVIDVTGKGEPEVSEPSASNPALPNDPLQGPSAAMDALGLNINTIVIDPGHGGEDPGAIGKGGLQEKEIVLDVGLRLKELLESRFGKKVIMTRDRDIFIPLEERTAIANSRGADLFLSIHVNASPRKEARGIETYLLGRSASREAMLTAARENSASEKSMNDLEEILTDLMTTVKKEESLRFAHYVQGSLVGTLQPRYPVVDLGVKQAPFYVLVNANMPSILAEISFVSNPDEEKRLANPKYREQIAEALLAGVEKYISTMKYASRQSE